MKRYRSYLLTFALLLVHVIYARQNSLKSGIPGTVEIHLLSMSDVGNPLDVSPQNIDFGTVRLGGSSSANVTLRNTGTAVVRFTLESFPRNFIFPVFPSELAPGATFVGTIVFKPELYGVWQSAILFRDSTQNLLNFVSLRGLCADNAVAELSYRTAIFPRVRLYGRRDTTVSITNTGPDTLKLLRAFMSPSFEYRSTGSIPPGASVVDTIIFHPSSVGLHKGLAILEFNTVLQHDSIALQGVCADNAEAQFSYRTLVFPNVRMNSRFDTTISITNTGQDTLRILSMASTNPSFQYRSAGSVPPAMALLDTISFHPSSMGRQTGEIVLRNSADRLDTIAVSGLGLGIPRVQVLPSTIDFGECTYADSISSVFTIKNSGSDTLRIDRISSSCADFVPLSTVALLLPDSLLTDTVRFVPQSSGVFASTILIYSDAPISPDTVSVHGIGLWKNWSALHTPFLSDQNLRIDRNGNYYVIATLGVLYKSSNRGISWTKLISDGSSFEYVLSLDVAPNGTLFAANQLGVHRSTDHGDSWQLSNAGFYSGGVRSVYVSPSGNVYAASFDTSGAGGLYRSTNNGEFWNHLNIGPLAGPVNAILETANGYIYAGLPRDGLKCSRDSGATWNPLFVDSSGAFISLLSAYGVETLYAGTATAGVLRSTDAGSTWDTVTHGFASIFTTALAVGPDGDVYVATYDGDVARSTDRGETWNHITGGLDGHVITSFAFSPDGYVYARAREGTIARSTFLTTSVQWNTATREPPPAFYSLEQNYPNPFNPSTTFSFSLPEATHVELVVYSLTGNEVAQLIDRQLSAGRYSLQWTPKSLSSGAYFVLLRTQKTSMTRKLILLK